MALDIEIPEVKPALELIDGRLVQKVSPRRAHAQLQGRWLLALQAWAGERGDALPEWRFSFAPPGSDWSSLVPDVGYVRRERLDAMPAAEAEEPQFAPDVAIEIISPSDRREDIAWKIAAYLAGGTALVATVDARSQQVFAHDRRATVTFVPGDTFAHGALPGFSLDVTALFDGVFRG
jgi:Uma2 family endonuclease